MRAGNDGSGGIEDEGCVSLAELEKELQLSLRQYQQSQDAVSVAQHAFHSARARLNGAQGAIDNYMARLKAKPPRDTKWGELAAVTNRLTVG